MTRNSRMGAQPYPGPDLSRECHAASQEFGRFPDGRTSQMGSVVRMN